MSRVMIETSLGAFGAAVLTLGAVQLASGHDLTGRLLAFSEVPRQDVNRSAKSDRDPGATHNVLRERTFSFNPAGLADTSILVRIPAAVEAPPPQDSGNAGPAIVPARSGNKAAVACEPVVSVLTDIAKQLQPGRCVT